MLQVAGQRTRRFGKPVWLQEAGGGGSGVPVFVHHYNQQVSMSLVLRQSTASQEILLGPFVDSTDGNTAETALTIANTDIKLFKHGGTTLTSKNSGGATHISDGYYYAVLDATDTDTIGNLEVNVKVSGALAVKREFIVVEEAVYDALFASSAPGPLTTLGTNAPSNWINAGAIEADAITDAKVASDVTIASVTGSVGSVTGNVGGNVVGSVGSVAGHTAQTGDVYALANGATGFSAIDTVVDAIKVKTDQLVFTVANQVDANALSGAGGLDAAGVRSAIGLASANLDTQLADIPTVSEFNARTIASADYATASSIVTVAGYLDTEIAAILEDTGTTIPAQIAALNNLSAAQVNAEVLDVLNVDTFAELSAPPAATSSLRAKLTWLFMWARNKATSTSSQRKLYADDGTTVVSTEALSDDSTTYTKGEAS